MKKSKLITILLFLFCSESFAEIVQAPNEKNYYRRSEEYVSNPETEPPQYVKQLDETGIDAFKKIDWIEAGLNYRARFEYRDNDYRRSEDKTDTPLLSRTQAYFGIKNIIDPLRFVVELQDSRRHNSKFSPNNSEVNKLDVFQAYGELYFETPKIIDRPIRVVAGRMAFEVLDRKMLSRDDWGNAGTNFNGVRVKIGKDENDWQLDSFALQPMQKLIDSRDHTNKNLWLYGGILNLRKWSEIVTLQPFYFKLIEEKSEFYTKRNIDSPGLRFYGSFYEDVFDYSLLAVRQSGESDNQKHRASAYAAEMGYNYKHKWQPRFSLVYGYASGDKNPNDSKNQRFERLYGFNRPWSNSNHIEWENLKTIKSRVELRTSKDWRFESSYSYYWLASSTDSWNRLNLQDTTGASGDDMGRDFDFRAHYNVNTHLRGTLGYAHFWPGRFAKNLTNRNDSSDFIYLELTTSLFGI